MFKRPSTVYLKSFPPFCFPKYPFSVHIVPQNVTNLQSLPRKPITIPYLIDKYLKNIPITMLTAQDYSSSSICDLAHIDMMLVGDSLAMTVLGHPNTLSVTMNEMIHHAKAVRRGNTYAFLVGDMPFSTYFNEEDGLRNAARFIQESEMNAVKLEGGKSVAPLVKRFTKAGIAVIGHIGLTPQHINLFGGFKVFGAKEVQEGIDLWEDAKALREAGASLIVLECVPEKLARLITKHLGVPTIGIGSGSGCSGQVLVFNDLMGIYDKLSPRFCKKFLDLNKLMVEACKTYKFEVETRQFPVSKANTFLIKEEIFRKVEEHINGELALITTKMTKLPEEIEEKIELEEKIKIEPIKNIVVLGSGALGSLMSSKLVKLNDKNVRILSGRQENVNFLYLTIKSQVENNNTFFQPSESEVKTFDIKEVISEWGMKIDLVLVCCKNYSTEIVLNNFLNLLPKDIKISCILTLQNGYGNIEIIKEILKKKGVITKLFPMSIYSGVKIEKRDKDSNQNKREIIQSLSSKIQIALPSVLSGSELEKIFTNGAFERRNYLKTTILKEKSFIDWEKLVVNSIINPLTAIFEVKNGEIGRNPSIKNMARMLIKEMLDILRLVPGSLNWVECDKEEIEETVFKKIINVANTTDSNISSMLVDILEGNMSTEIESMNGAFVKIAEGLKLHENSYSLNKLIVEMVNAKLGLKRK